MYSEYECMYMHLYKTMIESGLFLRYIYDYYNIIYYAMCDMNATSRKRHSAPFSGAWSDFPLVVYYYTVEYFSRTRNLERKPFATLRTGSTISDSALENVTHRLSPHILLAECIVVLYNNCINRVSYCSTVYYCIRHRIVYSNNFQMLYYMFYQIHYTHYTVTCRDDDGNDTTPPAGHHVIMSIILLCIQFYKYII